METPDKLGRTILRSLQSYGRATYDQVVRTGRAVAQRGSALRQKAEGKRRD
jgi:hypothetical protein